MVTSARQSARQYSAHEIVDGRSANSPRSGVAFGGVLNARTTNPPRIGAGVSFCLASDEPCGDLRLEPFGGDAVICGVLLNQDETPVTVPRGDAGRARPREGVEHHGAWLGERPNERHEAGDGLLRGVQPVAGVGPLQNIRGRVFG
jgi:hypothetical protein